MVPTASRWAYRRPGTAGRWSFQTSTPIGRPASAACSICALASIHAPCGPVPLPATSQPRLQPTMAGCRRLAARSARTRRVASAWSAGLAVRNSPGESTGPISCQSAMPAASRRSASAGASGCSARVAFAPAARSRATMRSMSSRGERVAVARDVLLQRRAAQDGPAPVDPQDAVAEAQLAQADPRDVGALERHAQLEGVQRAVAGGPQARPGHGDRGAQRGGRAGRDGPGSQREEPARPEAAEQRPGAAAARG